MLAVSNLRSADWTTSWSARGARRRKLYAREPGGLLARGLLAAPCPEVERRGDYAHYRAIQRGE
jgi:hypothetical protein